MSARMEYEWFESLPFLIIVSFFWFLLIPIPIVVYCFLRRLEKQQLSRLIIVRILGIDYYRKEIAFLKGEEYEEQFELEFDITEMAFQQLSRTHEALRRTYDELVFQSILEKRVEAETEKVTPDVNRLKLEDLLQETEKEKVMSEKKEKERPRHDRIRPVVKKNRIVITEEELFGDGLPDEDFYLFF